MTTRLAPLPAPDGLGPARFGAAERSPAGRPTGLFVTVMKWRDGRVLRPHPATFLFR
jgi:hypothetical protein